MTTSSNVSIRPNSEKIINLHFNDTKYNFVTYNQIIIDLSRIVV